jgi:purine-binding chemotaxis protein CheW
MKTPKRRSTGDWQEIRERLARAVAGLDGEPLTGERAQAILQERAHKLALVPPQAPPAAEVMEVLTFVLGEEHYAIETASIREVLPIDEFTPLPGGPHHLIGITNVRGQILALFELGSFLDVKASPGEHPKMIVLGRDRADFGIRADAVLEVGRLRMDEVLEPPESLAPAARSWLRGVTEEALLVLDGAALLKDPRLVIDAETGTGPAEVPS